MPTSVAAGPAEYPGERQPRRRRRSSMASECGYRCAGPAPRCIGYIGNPIVIYDLSSGVINGARSIQRMPPTSEPPLVIEATQSAPRWRDLHGARSVACSKARKRRLGPPTRIPRWLRVALPTISLELAAAYTDAQIWFYTAHTRSRTAPKQPWKSISPEAPSE
jgi:hypothetical protein